MAASLKTWVVATALVVVLAVAGGWLLVIGPARSAAAADRTQAAALESSTLRARSQLNQLAAQAKGLPQQKQAYDRLRRSIPTDADLPGVVRAFSAAAVAAHVELVGISPALPVPLAARGATSTGTGVAAPTVTTGSTTTGSTTTGSTKPGNAGGLQNLLVTVAVRGDYFAVQDYLRRVEELDRSTTITAVVIAPPDKGATLSSVSATISAHVFYTSAANAALPSTPLLSTGSPS